MSKRILIKGARVFDPAQSLDAEKDLLIEDGLIQAIEKPGSIAEAEELEIVGAKGLLLAPGLCNIHSHLREPGFEWKETVLSGSKAAVAGGFTDVCCMPNTKPVNDNAQITEFILDQAKIANLCRVHPVGAITKGLKGESLSPMQELKAAGAVAFSDDGGPVSGSAIMRKALEYSLMLDAVLTVHEEDTELSDGFSMNESALSLKLGLKGMPDAAENVMIARDIELARLTKAKLHFCHVSTARGVLLIKRAKEDGIAVTAEITPHHFTLTEDRVRDFDTQAKMSMPLRKQEDVDALLLGLEEGVIDAIADDHAPHEEDSKNVEFEKASFGILGFQTTLPLTLAKVREGKLSLNRAIEALTSAPAKCLNLNANKIAVGADASLTLIDLEKKVLFDRRYNQSKSYNTPFRDLELQGVAVKTFVAGRKVFDIEDLELSN